MVFVDNGGIESLWTFIKVILIYVIYIPVRGVGGGLGTRNQKLETGN